uniref:CCHC-type domain-containing protein n=1 Tax=Tanacetum cinerariifolium TaxID=118510 RepID=A0A6L2NT03_TANCI|nr:hypothetical protein [Tanacetum cinerariifolium]
MQTQTSNTLHNAIMEAGSKDRPPMLAHGNYVKWKSRIKIYIDTKPNHELIHHCLKNPPYKFTWADMEVSISEGIDNDIYSTVDACPNACEMWKAIERLKQGESINVQDLKTNLYWEFGKFTSQDGKSLESYYSRFYKMMNELIRNQCVITNHQVNVQFLLPLQPEWQRSQQAVTRNRGKAIVNSPQPIYDQEPSMVAKDDETSKDKEIDKLMALISLSFKKIYKPTKNNLRTLSNTSRANQDNSPRINRCAGYENQRIGNVGGARETVGSTVVQKSGIQCYNCKEVGHVARECQKPKRVKDTAYHREKMLLCKQKEAGIQLNAEQEDWKDDTDDDELEDHEMEAYYMYMAQLQDVSPDAADSGPIFDDEPLQKVSNNDQYNVFAIESEHPEQSESVHDTYPIEQDAHNVIINSLDMSYVREEIDQNDDDNDLANERELLASLIKKLKCEIDESKNRNKFLETSNKVLIEKLKGEIEDFKNKNKSLESSNNRFKESNNKLSETNNLLYTDFKKSEAELARRNSMEYASNMEIECAQVRGDFSSYKMESQRSFKKYTQTINDLNQTISELKDKLSAHQEIISILSQQKEAQIKLYKTREDKELDKVIALENKVKVADLALMLALESDEVIHLEKESRSKLSDLIRPFDYDKLNNLYDLFVPQREKLSEQRYFSERSRLSHTSVNNGKSKESFRKQANLLEKWMDESIQWDKKCQSSIEIFKVKTYVNTIFNGVELYSLRSQLETQKTQFLNEIDRLSKEYYYAYHMNAILGMYTELDENVSQEIRDQLNAEAEAVQIILTGIDNDIYSTVDACPNACEMWKAIERMLNNWNHITQEWQRFVTLVKQSQELKTVSYHKLYDVLKQHQHEVNEIRAEKIARVSNPLALVAQQQPAYHPQNHPTHYTQNSSTRSQQAATRNRGKEIVNSLQPIYDQEPSMAAEDDKTSKDKEIDKLMALISLSFKKIYKPTNNNLRTSSNTSRANQDNSPRINISAGYENQRIGNVAGARENVGSLVVQKSGIQCYNCKEFGHVAREFQKPKRAKDVAYHREKMLLCKQEEAGIQLNAEQADWRDDTDDDELKDQELEAYYMYMVQLQEVSPDIANFGPIFDDEPLQKVSYDDHYNVFAMESVYLEQSKSVHDTYPIEQDA